MAEPDPQLQPHPHARPAPLRAALALLLPLSVVLAFLLLVGGAGTAVVRWWLFDEAGSSWLLARLPAVKVQGFSGTLGGDRWVAEKVTLSWSGEQARLIIEGLSAQGLQWRWRPDAHAWLSFEAHELSAHKMTVITGPPSATPTPAPRDLLTPLSLAIGTLRVDTLQIDALAPITSLLAQGLLLDARPGQEHQIAAAQADWQGVHARAGLRVLNQAPLTLALQGQLRPALDGDAPRWAAVLSAAGALTRPEVKATLRGVPRPGADAPAIDLRAALRPFETWPVDQLQLATRELDLSSLSLRAPQTRLAGQAQLAARVAGAPLSALLELDNALPGRWNERRLPLARLSAELRGELARTNRVELPRFDLTLSDGARPAGRWSGSALWQDHELTLQTQLHDVAPQRLDSRAAAMRLSGPVQATLRGLPTPDGKPAPAPAAPSVNWKLDLAGALDASPQPVQLTMEGNATDQRLEVGRLRAAAGNASAELRAVLQRVGQRAGNADWKLDTSGSLVDFDPLPWWPGESGGAWRQGPHRLSAGWQLDLRLPGNAPQLPTVELLQRLAGTGSLRVHDSMLAGVPLAAELKLGYTQAAAPATVLLRADVSLGGNQLTLEGRGDPTRDGQNDRWRAELKGDSLASLAPLARLNPALADWAPRQGSVAATVAADGRWPTLRTEGVARISQLQLGNPQQGGFGLAQGQGSWQFDTAGERPLAASFTLAGLQRGTQRADHLTAELSGTLAEHRIDISGALPLRPPAMAVQVLGVQAQSGTRAQMLAQGQWRPEPTGGGQWRARIERLVLGSWDGSADNVAPASVWMQARDLRALFTFGPGGTLQALQADAGRLQLADAAVLRWDEVKADWRNGPPQIELRADVEPFLLAPLLARAQPGLGWQGDLRVTARINVRAAEKMDAEVQVLRADGDLHVAGGEGTQLMGLTDARLQVTAHEGNWVFTPLFKGRSLGEIAGELRVKTSADKRWPPPDAAVEGELQARVADVGIWGAWVPPGWRLGGELRGSARVSGRFGEPRYTGELTGNGLAVRNLLQGVNVSEGQVRVLLEGDRAVIETLRFKGGDGTLDITGQASLGPSPQARLRLVAERFRLVGRVDRTVVASGQADFNVAGDQYALNGRFKLDDGLWDASGGDAPSLDGDVTVRGAGTSDAEGPGSRPPAARRNFALDLDIDLGPRARVKGYGVDTGLTGSVRLTNPQGRLAVRGTINADEGTYRAYGQKLAIERGIVAFGGPPDDPRLDILAIRPNTDTRVGVNITGTAQNPRIRLFSDPEMSDTEKLSWLLLGRAADGLGRADTALLQRAAVALLSGEGEAPTDTLLRNLGIDELSLKQGEGDVRETVISLGKQLSRRWYLGYERGVNSTTGTWQLIYRIARRFTVRAQSGLENSLDVIWTWRFQETAADAAMRKSTVTPPDPPSVSRTTPP